MHPDFFRAVPRQHIGPVHQFLEHSMHMPPALATAVITVFFAALLLAGIGAGFRKVFS